MAIRIPIILAALLAVPTLAYADVPSKYDHPYSGTIEKHLVRYGQAWAKCTELDPNPRRPKMLQGRHLYGCAIGGKLEGKKKCIIVYSWDMRDKQMRSNVYRHEVAHCNGWPAHHPQ